MAEEKKTKQSPGVMQEEKLKEQSTEQYTPKDEAAIKAQSLHFKRLLNARDTREQSRREFDGMTFMQDYQANLDAANTYLTPKKNDDEVRVNTATSEKKIDTLENELIAMNIQSEIEAFDQHDMEVIGLGKDMEHLVYRTNQIEKEEDKWQDFVRELITQRALFVEEKVVTRKVKNSTYTIKRAEKTLFPGTKVYLGNIRIPAYKFNEQPYFCTLDTFNHDYLRTIWGDNPNWDKVKPGGRASTGVDEENLYDFRMSNTEETDDEVLVYRSYVDNEYQVYISGVPMFPPGTTLDYDHEGYKMVMVTVKPVRPNFAYGKPPIASAKTLQALENETIRNLIRKFRQALEPPIGTTANQIFSRNIWSAGAVTQGVTKNMFEKLIDHDGVTQSEMNMYQIIKDQTTEFIGASNLLQGMDSGKDKTATQTMKELEQAIKGMGQAVGALMRLRRDLTILRIYSIIEDYTRPTGKMIVPDTGEMMDRYQEFTIKNVDLGTGRRGTKIIKFTNFDLTPDQEQAIYDKEQESEMQGQPLRIRTINAEKLNSFPLFWNVIATNKEKAGSAINKLMHSEKMAQVADIEAKSQGQVKGNWNKLAESTELVWADKDMFQKSAPGQLNEMPPEDNGVVNEAKDMMSKIQGGMESNTGFGAQMTEAPRGQTRLNPSNVMAGSQG